MDLCLYQALLETTGGWLQPVLQSGQWFQVIGAKATSRHRFGVVIAVAVIKNMHAYVSVITLTVTLTQTITLPRTAPLAADY